MQMCVVYAHLVNDNNISSKENFRVELAERFVDHCNYVYVPIHHFFAPDLYHSESLAFRSSDACNRC